MANVTQAAAHVQERLRSMLTFKPLVYGYANARVRAMRSALVSAQQMRAMLEVGSTSEAVEMLQRAAYKDDLVPLSLKYKGEELVELALGASFARYAQKLRRITPKDGKLALEALLARYDVRNLKTVLLGKRLGRSFEDVSPFIIMAGTLTPKELREIMEAPDTAATYLKIRNTHFGKTLFEGKMSSWMSSVQMKQIILGFGSESGSEVFVDVLDAYYFRLAEAEIMPSDPDRAAISRMLQLEADAKNISTVLRLKKSGADRAKMMRLIVRGSSQPGRFWEGIADEESLEKTAEKISRKFGLDEAHAKFKEDGKISHFEIALEQAAAKSGLRAMARQQLSLGAIIGALLLKEQEMNSIRKIVRGKALGLSKERIGQMLVLVE